MKPGSVVKKNEYTDYIVGVDITCDVLLHELNMDNQYIVTAKTIIISRIAERFDLVRYAYENKLLNHTDIMMIFLNLIICFDANVNTEVMDYIIDVVKLNIINSTVINTISCMLHKSATNCYLLFDWFRNKNRDMFACIITYFLHTANKKVVLDYIDTYTEILECADCGIIQSMCASFDLNTMLGYLTKLESYVQENNIPYKKFIQASISNVNNEVFEYFIKHHEYQCTDFNNVLKCIEYGNFNRAKILYDTYQGATPDENIVSNIHRLNRIDVLKFFAEQTKIDLHVKNNMLFRYLIIDENCEMIKFLLDCEDKLGLFNVPNDPYINKILPYNDNPVIMSMLGLSNE